MDSYLWPRTYKAWELTIDRMRGYIGDDSILNERDGQRIARFLAAHVGEDVLLVPPGMERGVDAPSLPGPVAEVAVSPPRTVDPVSAPAAEATGEETPEASPPMVASIEPAPVALVPAVAAQTGGTVSRGEASVQRPKFSVPPLKRLWNPGRSALRFARLTGFAAVAALIGLLVSGFGRRRLKTNFRPVHKRLAAVLLAALSIHGVIYIFEYGSPNVLWYWFGFAGLVVLIAVQAQGKLRRRYRLGPLSWHIAAGCAGLLLSVLHWIWAWL